MLPFSKRPPPPEEYFLRSGDYEAARPSPNDVQIPSAPRAPIFARHSSQTPYGYSQPNQAVWQNNNDVSLSAPPPPNSLAPVAMGGPNSTRGNFATATGSHGPLPAMTGDGKPSLKWGVMIALTGALLGGVLGLGMDARRQAARAAAAATAAENAPAMVAANQLSAPSPVAVPVAQPVVVAPAAVPVVNTPPPAQVQAPVIVSPPAPVVVAGKTKPAPHAVRPVRPSAGSIAVKVNKPAPEPKADKPDPVVKADPPEPKTPKGAAPKKDVSAAQQILEAANKDTVNTL